MNWFFLQTPWAYASNINLHKQKVHISLCIFTVIGALHALICKEKKRSDSQIFTVIREMQLLKRQMRKALVYYMQLFAAIEAQNIQHPQSLNSAEKSEPVLSSSTLHHWSDAMRVSIH